MISTYIDYLKEVLKASGIKTRILTTEKELKGTNESRIGAIWINKDTITRVNGNKKVFEKDGQMFTRKQIFDRSTTFNVIIGDYEDKKCEKIFENFLHNIREGIFKDGNYIAIELGNAEWADEGDSILKSKRAVNLEVTFHGGVYKDMPRIVVRDIQISVEMED